MIFARRLFSRDEAGDVTLDYEAAEMPRLKVARPFDDSTPAYRQRVIKMRAIKILRENGMTAEETALAVELSARHVKRRSALIRQLAEASGRV
jgi:hypothetical protein